MNTFYFKENLNESIVTDFKDKFGDELFSEFQSVKNRITNPRVKELILQQGVEDGNWNDISYWMPKSELELADFIDIANIAIEQKDQERADRVASIDELSKFTYLDDHEGADLLYNDDQWEVYKINTIEASRHLGSNTRWCISGTHVYVDRQGRERTAEDYFGEYIGIANIYFYMDKVNHHKYAAVAPHYAGFKQIFNDNNDTVNEIPNEPNVRGVSNLENMEIEVIYEDDKWRLEKVLNTCFKDSITNNYRENDDNSCAYYANRKEFGDANRNLYDAREFAALGEDERNLILNYYIPAGIFSEDDID